MSDSSWKPLTNSPPCSPEVYWPRAECSPRSSGSTTDSSTLAFSRLRWLALNEAGSSMAVRASSWSRWFWITSRAAPTPS